MGGEPDEEPSGDEEYVLEEDVEFDDDDDDDEYFDEDTHGFDPAGAPDSTFATSLLSLAEQKAQFWDPATRLERQAELVGSVVETLGVGEGAALLLLRAFKWDSRQLQERFFSDSTAVAEKHCVMCYIDPIVEATEPTQCQVCFTTPDEPARVVGLGACQHMFCVDCYGQYLAFALTEGGPKSVATTCIVRGCRWIVEKEAFVSILSRAELQKPFAGRNAALVERYNDYIGRSFVDDNPCCKWCPAPNCDKVAYVKDLLSLSGASSATQEVPRTALQKLYYPVDGVKERDMMLKPVVVTCSCGFSFCCICGEAGHTPAKCYMLRNWQRKQRDESETGNWLTANTKPCPGCGAAIEKNAGCNHITCMQCKYSFCWVCEQEWSKHGSNWYSCNFFQETEATTERDRAREDHKRYMFYYSRYANHDKSRYLERRILEAAQQSMTRLQEEQKDKLHETEFLADAAQQLNKARETLKYSYAYAYHLKHGKEKDLFEYNQAQLELSTEELSRMLETYTNPRRKDKQEPRQTIINQHALVRRSLERLQQGIFDSEKLLDEP